MTVQGILDRIQERKDEVLENMKEIQKQFGTNNLGYAAEMGALDELNSLVDFITDTDPCA